MVGGDVPHFSLAAPFETQGKQGEHSDCPPALRDDGDLAVFLARGLYGDLDVLPEGGEKVHETFDGEGAGAVAYQGRDVRLLDAEDFSSFDLREAASFDETIDLQRKLCF